MIGSDPGHCKVRVFSDWSAGSAAGLDRQNLDLEQKIRCYLYLNINNQFILKYQIHMT